MDCWEWIQWNSKFYYWIKVYVRLETKFWVVLYTNEKPGENDTVIFNNLHHDFPDLYKIQSSIIESKYILYLKLIFELYKSIDEKITDRFLNRNLNDIGNNCSNDYNTVKSILTALEEKCKRLKMHTFFELVYDFYSNDYKE